MEAKCQKENLGLLLILSVLHCCYSVEIVDVCLEDSIYIGHQEGIVGVDTSTITALTERPCVLRVETYSNCYLSIEPYGDDFAFNHCPLGKNHSTISCTTGCDYIFLFDAYYRDQTLKFVDSSAHTHWFDPFQTTSSSLFVGLCHTGKPLKFQLKYTTKDKWKTIESSSEGLLSKGKINSPFFPDGYVQNSEPYTYYFKRMLTTDHVHLTFDDWNLAPGTEFFFENSNIPGLVDGENHRPVVVSDKGHDLRVIFNTGRASNPGGSGTYMGYKATYQFVSENENVVRPLTNCGGYYLNSDGGTIDFEFKGISAEFYDCLWVVKTFPGYAKTYLKLIDFKSKSDYYQGEVNFFEIRRGLTSSGIQIGKVYPNSIDRARLGFEDRDGFYIRLKGKFSPADRLKLSYASFTLNKDCKGSNTFRCSDGKCISASLKCDGVGHCGASSDENYGCSGSYYDWQRSQQYTITISVIVPLVIAVFLIIVLCVIFMMVRRCRRNRLLEQVREDHIPSVSGDVSDRQRRRRRNGRHRDAPPSYEEVLQNTPVGYLNHNFGFSNPDFPSVLQPPSYDEAIGTRSNQEFNDHETQQPHNSSPASSSDTSASELLEHHRNLNSLSSDSTASSRVRPSVHSYSMSYSSDSEMDSPRVNREQQVMESTTSLRHGPVHKVTDENEECCQVSEQDVRPKHNGNKVQSNSLDEESHSNYNIHEHSRNCQQRERQCLSSGSDHGGPSEDVSRTSASTQTKKKRNKHKKSEPKQPQNIDENQASCDEEVQSRNQREEGNIGRNDSVNDSENLAFNFNHFDEHSYNHNAGHSNAGFSGSEDNSRFDSENHHHQISDIRYTDSRSGADTGDGAISRNGASSRNRRDDIELVAESCSSPEPEPQESFAEHHDAHTDSLPVQSQSSDRGGQNILRLLNTSNDSDVFV